MNSLRHESNDAAGQPAGDAIPGERPTNVRWTVFGLCCGTSWILYLHRYTFALIKPSLAKEWNLDEVQLGGLDSAFGFTYAFAQVPAGLMGDLLGAHLFLGAIIILWSLTLGMHALAPNAVWLTGVRAAFGLTQAGCYPTIGRVSRLWFPRSVRTSLQGWIASFFGRTGGACANVIFATVMLGWFAIAWRPALLGVSALGVLFGLLFLLVYRNSPREHPRANEAETKLIEADEPTITGGSGASTSDRMSIRTMLASMNPRSLRNFCALLVQQFASTFADQIYVVWVPFFLATVHGLNFQEMGLYSSLPLFGGALGGMVGGYLNDGLIRITGNRRWSRSSVGSAGKGIACLLIFGALAVYENPYLFCVVLFFVKFFSDWSQPTAWGTATDIGGRATATVFGFNNMVGCFGGIVAPLAFGIVAKYDSWQTAFLVVGGAYLIASLSWLFVDCTIPLFEEEDANRQVKD